MSNSINLNIKYNQAINITNIGIIKDLRLININNIKYVLAKLKIKQISQIKT